MFLHFFEIITHDLPPLLMILSTNGDI